MNAVRSSFAGFFSAANASTQTALGTSPDRTMATSSRGSTPSVLWVDRGLPALDCPLSV